MAEQRLQNVAEAVEDMHGAQLSDVVSDTVRNYIESVFSIPATRATTEEFLLQALSDPILRPHREELQLVLNHCDVAKFSGQRITDDEKESLLSGAMEFVHSTHKALLSQKRAQKPRWQRWFRLRQGVSQ